jgi:uncharacterized protein GlcG (DUF336 family)
MKGKFVAALTGFMLSTLAIVSAGNADSIDSGCRRLPGHAALKAALTAARAAGNGGFNLDMWGAIVNRDGIVCTVAFTGSDRTKQWPGSRAISAQKANTANAFSLPALALSSANLWAATQPGGTLYGLQESNPVDTDTVYKGPSVDYGTEKDPMIGKKPGGINVFGGGLALYNKDQELVGALGVSGDTSCADHNIAWRTRNTLHLDYVPSGVSGDTARPDNINYLGRAPVPSLANDFSHPVCAIAGSDKVTAISAKLPRVSTKSTAAIDSPPPAAEPGTN